MTTPHLMLIQSCYTDQGLSARRLYISLETSIPSLKAQTCKPEIRVVVHPDDPWLILRLSAFRSTGCEVRELYRTEWRLYGEDWELPEGRKLVSRMDDDDVIASDFCERTRAAADRQGEWAMIWPEGYVFFRNQVYRVQRRQTPFVSLLTSGAHDPHERPHARFHREWPSEAVSDEPGWIWVRHGDTATPTLPRYRRRTCPGIDDKRFAVSLPRIHRAIAASGVAADSYR